MWTLLLFFQLYAKPSTAAIDGFTDKVKCEEAGKALKKRYPNLWTTAVVDFECIEVR
jgi:hypothetical protein